MGCERPRISAAGDTQQTMLHVSSKEPARLADASRRKYNSRPGAFPGPKSRSTQAMNAVRNILFIMCDQLRADHLGCYGHPFLATTHLDELARRGVRFDRAFVQSGV